MPHNAAKRFISPADCEITWRPFSMINAHREMELMRWFWQSASEENCPFTEIIANRRVALCLRSHNGKILRERMREKKRGSRQ